MQFPFPQLKQIRLLFGLPPGLTEEERRSLLDWEKRSIFTQGRHAVVICSIVMPIMAFFCYVLAPEVQRGTMVATHGTVGLITLVMALTAKNWKADVRYGFLATEIVFAVGYARVLHITFNNSPDINDLTFLSSIYIATIIITLTLHPFWNGLVFAAAAFEIGLGMWAWTSVPYFDPWTWGIVSTLAAIGGISLSYARAFRVRREALGEMAIRNLLVQADSSRLASVQADLAQASEIHDSFAPRASIINSLGLVASFYQHKYDLLGGDWSAARALDSGDFAVVVADASGRGIQAALVMHAIQTLWASSLAAAEFDPMAWLQIANKTLLALGQRKEHTLSLGILVFNEKSVHYYSAGAIPLFLICKDHARFNVIPVAAHGKPLGQVQDPMIAHQDVDLTRLRFDSLLLGTDGVFDRGIRTRSEAVLALLRNLEENGADALEHYPAMDDKLVVWLRKAA